MSSTTFASSAVWPGAVEAIVTRPAPARSAGCPDQHRGAGLARPSPPRPAGAPRSPCARSARRRGRRAAIPGSSSRRQRAAPAPIRRVDRHARARRPRPARPARRRRRPGRACGRPSSRSRRPERRRRRRARCRRSRPDGMSTAILRPRGGVHRRERRRRHARAPRRESRCRRSRRRRPAARRASQRPPGRLVGPAAAVLDRHAPHALERRQRPRRVALRSAPGGAAAATRTATPGPRQVARGHEAIAAVEPAPQTIALIPARAVAAPARAGRRRRRPAPRSPSSSRLGTPSALRRRRVGGAHLRGRQQRAESPRYAPRAPPRSPPAARSTASRIPISTARATRPWPMLSSSSPGSAATGPTFA